MQAAHTCVRMGLAARFIVARCGNHLDVHRQETAAHSGFNPAAGRYPLAGNGLELHMLIRSSLSEMLFHFIFFLKQDVELAFTQYSVHIEYGDTGEMVKQSYFWSVGIKVWGREVCFIDFSLDNLVNNLTFTTGVDYFCRT